MKKKEENPRVVKAKKSRKGLKIFLIVFFILALLLGSAVLGYFLWFEQESRELAAYFPEKSEVQVFIKQPVRVWKDLEKSPLWKAWLHTPAVKEASLLLEEIKNSLGEERNRDLLDMLFDRQVALAFSDVQDLENSMVIALDLGIKIKMLETADLLKEVFNPAKKEISFKEEQILGERVSTIRLLKQKSSWSFLFLHNVLLVGKKPVVFKPYIEVWQKKKLPLSEKTAFLHARANMPDNSQAQLFLSGDSLRKLSALQEEPEKQEEKDLFALSLGQLDYCAVGLFLRDDVLLLDGFSSLDYKEAPQALQELFQQQAGSSSMIDYVPGEASSFSQFVFSSFEDIWDFSLMGLKMDKKAYQEYLDSKEMVEGVLKIDIEKQLLAWIGTEIAVMNLPPLEYSSVPEAVLMIKSSDPLQAKESLDQIKKSITKRLPLKFEEKQYKGAVLTQLDLPVFFKLFFGALFRKMTKPYWGLIGDYVAFSDSMETLEYLVDTYYNESSLKTWPAYQQVVKVLPSKMNARFYFDAEGLLNTVRPYLNKDGVKLLNDLKPYLDVLDSVALQFSNQNQGLRQSISLAFKGRKQELISLKWKYPFSRSFSSPPIAADLDADGKQELIACADNGYVLVLRDDGKMMTPWPKKVADRALSPAAVAQFDDDREKEIALSAGNKLLVFNHDGTMASGWPVELESRFCTTPVFADLDGDQGMELLAAAWDRQLYVYRYDGSLVPGFPVQLSSYAVGQALVFDGENDGRKEIYLSTANGNLYRIENDGQIPEAWPLAINTLVKSGATAARLKNKKWRIFLSAVNGKCYAYNPQGEIQPGWPVDTGYINSALPVCADLDNDGNPEILQACENRKLYVWKQDGKTLPGWPRSARSRFKSEIVAGDIDSDGWNEVIAACEDGKLYAWNHKGQALADFPKRGSVAPVLGDFNGNGDLELLTASWDRNIFLWMLSGEKNSRRVEWSSFANGPQNQALYLKD